MRLLVTRRMTAAAEKAIAEAFDASFRDETVPLTEAEAIAALRGHDAILPTLGDPFNAAVLARPERRARVLANFGAGFNHIDIEAAKAAGIVVTNTPDVVTDATADIALTLILMTARRAGEGERLVRAGRWTGWHPTQMLGMHVTGRTLGIVGMGRIGQAIARRGHHGFGMKVVFHNRSTVMGLDLPALQVPLPDLLAQADIVVAAVPGGASTRHLIGGAELAAMKPGAILVNIARGDVVDEAALIAALEAGTIAGAGLDVYEREPLVPEALRTREDVVLLPHLGTATEEVRTDMALRALANLTAFFRGDPPPDRVV
ncbi:D-glycerate dehydrogenase [Paracoccus sp. (in: a-proteobacteria)]|uniref:2-hydroxyacid dehydrogenase n=1 Tax=Paracoccus sp. TaxID=267 RepID=UPI0026E0B48E|nr:D-glycerate dehydrogenase [Paracoccus sp. (in: a-proteobacteria)]MDO5369304.1 D-glycerate dehydrogenase [Paracoccus sp. (in: a-proteobacteria)]